MEFVARSTERILLDFIIYQPDLLTNKVKIEIIQTSRGTEVMRFRAYNNSPFFFTSGTQASLSFH